MKKLILLSLLFSNLMASVEAKVSLEKFNEIAKIFHREYDSEFINNNSLFIINNAPPAMPLLWWNQELAHASYSSYIDEDNNHRTHYLFLFGGYARQPFMNELGVIMTLCHELGHGIGGSPYKIKSENYNVSTEGQSDYFAARYCFRRIINHYPEILSEVAPNEYAKTNCDQAYQAPKDRMICYKSFEALDVEREYFRHHEGTREETALDTPDLSIASETILEETYYPSAQCRLDTMINGILNKPRPICWFVK